MWLAPESHSVSETCAQSIRVCAACVAVVVRVTSQEVCQDVENVVVCQITVQCYTLNRRVSGFYIYDQQLDYTPSTQPARIPYTSFRLAAMNSESVDVYTELSTDAHAYTFLHRARYTTCSCINRVQYNIIQYRGR